MSHSPCLRSLFHLYPPRPLHLPLSPSSSSPTSSTSSSSITMWTLVVVCVLGVVRQVEGYESYQEDYYTEDVFTEVSSHTQSLPPTHFLPKH